MSEATSRRFLVMWVADMCESNERSDELNLEERLHVDLIVASLQPSFAPRTISPLLSIHMAIR